MELLTYVINYLLFRFKINHFCLKLSPVNKGQLCQLGLVRMNYIAFFEELIARHI